MAALPLTHRAVIFPDVNLEEEATMQALLDEFDIELSPDEILVNAWRAEQLERLGITRIVAEAMASLVDWRELMRLVDRGCPPALAMEIVR